MVLREFHVKLSEDAPPNKFLFFFLTPIINQTFTIGGYKQVCITWAVAPVTQKSPLSGQSNRDLQFHRRSVTA
jgi:hypothetical protein